MRLTMFAAAGASIVLAVAPVHAQGHTHLGAIEPGTTLKAATRTHLTPDSAYQRILTILRKHDLTRAGTIQPGAQPLTLKVPVRVDTTANVQEPRIEIRVISENGGTFVMLQGFFRLAETASAQGNRQAEGAVMRAVEVLADRLHREIGSQP